MSLSIGQLKGMMETPGLSGRIAINDQGENAQVEKTGIGHFFKTLFGFKSAKAKNEATLNAIRSAFRDDPRLMVGYDKADRMLSRVKGTITAEKVREIISSVEDAVSKGKIDDDDKQQSVVNATKGRLASQGMPRYIAGVSKSDKGRFMQTYSANIANAMPNDSWKSKEAQDEAIQDAKDCYDAMFEDIAQGEDHIYDRYWMVKILSACKSNPIVDADGKLKSPEDCKTFANDMLSFFNNLTLADKHRVLTALENIDEPVSVEDLQKLVDAGQAVDTGKLESLFPNAVNGPTFPGPGDLPSASKFIGELSRLYVQVSKKVAEITADKGFSTKNIAQMEKLAFQSTITSLHYKYVARIAQMFSAEDAPEGSLMNYKNDADRLMDDKELRGEAGSTTREARIAFKSLRLPVFLVWEKDIADGKVPPMLFSKMTEEQISACVDKVKVGEKDIIHVDDLNKKIDHINLDESFD